MPTRPIANGGYGVSAAKAEQSLRRIWAALDLLEESPDVFNEWWRLAIDHGLVGKSVHDANVVATTLAHGATHLLTLKVRDFRPDFGISTIVP